MFQVSLNVIVGMLQLFANTHESLILIASLVGMFFAILISFSSIYGIFVLTRISDDEVREMVRQEMVGE